MERAPFAARLGRALCLACIFASVFASGCDSHSAGKASPASLDPVPATRPPNSPGENGFPAKLVKDVEDLIRLTAEYNALAARVASLEDYRRHTAELQAIEERLAACVAAVTFGEAQLTPAQRRDFDNRYYAKRAQPLIEEKRAHQRRFKALLESAGCLQRQPDWCESAGSADRDSPPARFVQGRM